VAGYYNSAVFEDENAKAVKKMGEFIQQFALKNTSSSSPAVIQTFDNFNVRFISQGPTIINLGYFPDWRNINGGAVYPVTPGQMLVFAQGTTTLFFSSGLNEKISAGLSLVLIIAIIILGILLFWHCRHKLD